MRELKLEQRILVTSLTFVLLYFLISFGIKRIESDYEEKLKSRFMELFVFPSDIEDGKIDLFSVVKDSIILPNDTVEIDTGNYSELYFPDTINALNQYGENEKDSLFLLTINKIEKDSTTKLDTILITQVYEILKNISPLNKRFYDKLKPGDIIEIYKKYVNEPLDSTETKRKLLLSCFEKTYNKKFKLDIITSLKVFYILKKLNNICSYDSTYNDIYFFVDDFYGRQLVNPMKKSVGVLYDDAIQQHIWKKVYKKSKSEKEFVYYPWFDNTKEIGNVWSLDKFFTFWQDDIEKSVYIPDKLGLMVTIPLVYDNREEKDQLIIGTSIRMHKLENRVRVGVLVFISLLIITVLILIIDDVIRKSKAITITKNLLEENNLKLEENNLKLEEKNSKEKRLNIFADKCRDIVSNVKSLRSYQNAVKDFLFLVREEISPDIMAFCICHKEIFLDTEILLEHVYEIEEDEVNDPDHHVNKRKLDEIEKNKVKEPDHHVNKRKLDEIERIGVLCFVTPELQTVIMEDFDQEYLQHAEKYRFTNKANPEPEKGDSFNSHIWHRIEMEEGEKKKKLGYFSIQSKAKSTFNEEKHNDYITILNNYISILIKYMQINYQESINFDEYVLKFPEKLTKNLKNDTLNIQNIYEDFFVDTVESLNRFYSNQYHFNKIDCFGLLLVNKEKTDLIGWVCEPYTEKSNIDENKRFNKDDDNYIYFNHSFSLSKNYPSTECYKKGIDVVMNDYDKDKEMFGIIKDDAESGGNYDAIIYTPIFSPDNNVIGVMTIQTNNKYTLNIYDLAPFKIFSKHISFIIQIIEETYRNRIEKDGFSVEELRNTPPEIKKIIEKELTSKWNQYFRHKVYSYQLANDFGNFMLKTIGEDKYMPLTNYAKKLSNLTVDGYRLTDLIRYTNYFKTIVDNER